MSRPMGGTGLGCATLLIAMAVGCADDAPASDGAGAAGVAGAGGHAIGGAGVGAAGAGGKVNAGGQAGAGFAGTQGSSGKAGAAGSAGVSGTSGAAGSAGASGKAGAAGSAGGAGKAGAAGGSGKAGASGAAGSAGIAGSAGAAGTAGATGSGGTAGKAGAGGAGAGGSAGGAGVGGAAGSTEAGGAAGGGASAGAAGAAGGGPLFGIDTRPSNPTCKAPPRPLGGSATVSATPVFADKPFNQPVALFQAPGDTSRFFVVERAGAVKVFADAGPASDFIDLTSRVNSGTLEAGLLGMAFHPNFSQNGQVFVSYTGYGGGPVGLVSTLSRFTSKDGGLTLDSASEDVLFTLVQPFSNHNGGNLAFGKDGYLYFGLGDGGSGGDPFDNGQTLDSWFGKMLRFDVDGGTPYAIPPDNPFAGGGGKPEIFAWGLRNPWRFSFDRATGDLWVGDVGQSAWEEIDVVKLGGNYGWHDKEGSHCYAIDPCVGPYIDPIVEYDHGVGQSVTGGYVYRGAAIPSLWGSYLFADYVAGSVFRVVYDPQTGKPSSELLLSTSINVSSFGEDLAGELYLVDLKGAIYRIDAAGASPPDPFPTLLSQTGCVQPGDATAPAEGLIPYGVNAPFWSDGAKKQRWLAIPDGTTISLSSDGDMDLPVGSVVMKTFEVQGQRAETRLFVRHDDGGWAGYSYEWNDQGTDATYLPAAKEKVIGGQTWHYPSSAECLSCHTAAAGRTLGLETLQLNGPFAYPGGVVADQLATLDHLQLFTGGLPAPPAALPALPDPFGAAAAPARARAYLHTNCSMCHRAGGTGVGTADYRFALDFSQIGACNADPQAGDLGVTGAKILVPGSPATSVMSLRLHAGGANRMPPLASNVHDALGIGLVDGWIAGMADCNGP